jgi:hypothetical protein
MPECRFNKYNATSSVEARTPQALVESIQKVSTTCGPRRRRRRREEEFFHYKNDLKRHAHTPSGVAGADLKS